MSLSITIKILVLTSTIAYVRPEKDCENLPKLEILPGAGYDALTDKDMDQTRDFTYSQCKTTTGGDYLIPDNVDETKLNLTTRVKVDVIEHWFNYTSLTASRFEFSDVWPVKYRPLCSAFSNEYQELKGVLIKSGTFMVRSYLREITHRIRIQPDVVLNGSLKEKFNIAIDAFSEGNKVKAEYVLQTIVRDYGTHYTKSVDFGGVVVKEDFLPTSFLMTHDKDMIKMMSTFSLLGLDKRWRQLNPHLNFARYESSIVDSKLTSIGKIYSINLQSALNLLVKRERLSLVNRQGELLTGLVSTSLFPEVSESTLFKVKQLMGKAIRDYYTRNAHEGCTNSNSPNFDPAANIDDDTCQSEIPDYSFGGMYQDCHPLHSRDDDCVNLTINNPLTGAKTCPPDYETKLLTYRSALFKRYLSISTTVCMGMENATAKYPFGGVFSPEVNNIFTKMKMCPPSYSTYTFLDGKLSICVSRSITESTKNFSLSFGGFTTSVNRLHCPVGHRGHFATVYDGHEIYYCVKEQTWSIDDYVSTPPLSRPPYMANYEFLREIRKNRSYENNTNVYAVIFYVLLLFVIVAVAGISYWQRKGIVECFRLRRYKHLVDENGDVEM